MSSSNHPSSQRIRGVPLRSTAPYIRPTDEPRSELEQLADEAAAEMDRAWQAGRHITAEQCLERQPRLASDPEAAVRVILEEICLREEQGEHVASQEIYRRFPQWKHELEVVLDCQRLLDDREAPPVFPEAGQQLGELQLLRELGRGGLGRVFLATQPSLSDRPLVVKLTPRTGEEHLSLSRLQHTHIAPLYLVQEFPPQGLRALCMPYLGSANWSRILHSLKSRPIAQRTGRDIVEQLERESTAAPLAPPVQGPALRFLVRATYVEAICWIGSCLADALAYAHQRGLVHLDIKPSNVLLANDGQPMLLDFHLAREALPAGSQPVDRLGGTRGYMSREQQLCGAAVRDGRALPATLDGRSDIYSLGVLLYESLAGQLPPGDEASSRMVLQQANSAVSRGLADIVHKCLATDAAQRYRDANQLATDLRRHLAALPLEGVANRSLLERWQKWRRRRPQALTVLVVGLTALAVSSSLAVLFHRDRVRNARGALVEARQDSERGVPAQSIDALDKAVYALRWFPWQSDLRRELTTELAAARRARLGGKLHDLVEQLRLVDAVAQAPPHTLRKLDAGCRQIWQARENIARLDETRPEADSDSMLRTDLLDLALLWSHLQIMQLPPDADSAARQEALRVLDEAGALLGESPVLNLARKQYARAGARGKQPPEFSASSDAGARNGEETAAIGRLEENDVSPAVAALPLRSAWEHYAVGRLLLQSDQVAAAQAEFAQSLRRQPQAFWPNFYYTLCAYRREQFETALATAYVCVALSPSRAECFFNRALCHQALGHTELAYQDFSRALELDPRSPRSAFQQGATSVELHEPRRALAELEHALSLGAEPAPTHYQMALACQSLADPAAIQSHVQESLRHDPDYAPAQALRDRITPAP